MRNQISNVLWGLLLVVIGLGFAGNAFDLWDFELFFAGWWTLFIIVPCIISIIQNGLQLWTSLGLGVGILLFISAQGFLNSDLLGQLIFPIIIIAIGLSIIFKGRLHSKRVEGLRKDGLPDYSAIFGGQDLNLSGENFKGADVTAVFGSVSLDLRQSIIQEDLYMTTTAIFGAVEIMIPNNIRVEITATPIFGAATNKSNPPLAAEDPITLYINSTNIFGGTEIK